jgi:hypothetical protein
MNCRISRSRRRAPVVLIAVMAFSASAAVGQPAENFYAGKPWAVVMTRMRGSWRAISGG